MTDIIDITDKSRKPGTEELCRFVGNPLFEKLCAYMNSEYQAVHSIEYSGDNVLLGWNLKFKKSGRTLCTVYPRKGYFHMLLIVGRKEKERVEAILPLLSAEFQKVYNSTREGMGQRWLIFDFDSDSAFYGDVLKVIRIRRESK